YGEELERFRPDWRKPRTLPANYGKFAAFIVPGDVVRRPYGSIPITQRPQPEPARAARAGSLRLRHPRLHRRTLPECREPARARVGGISKQRGTRAHRSRADGEGQWHQLRHHQPGWLHSHQRGAARRAARRETAVHRTTPVEYLRPGKFPAP